MVKLSYIVPVYNVEKYLRKCVDSLLAQDYSDYEIILVDDGSTDGSGAICDEYVREFEIGDRRSKNIQLRVIHQANGGLSVARNAGLKEANGEYVCFVDSDDYWEENVLNGLMKQIEQDNLDVLRFRFQNVNEQGEIVHPYKSDPANDNDYSDIPIDGVSFLNSRMNTQCYAVMFIIRRNLIIGDRRLEIGDCLFAEGIYFEDTDWTPRMLVKAHRVASTNTVVYNYLQREGSITKAVNRSKQQKVLDDKMRLIGEMQRQSKELQEKGLNNAWFSRMIADTIISVIGILSVDFYSERKGYLEQLEQMNVYPLTSKSTKAKLINLSPQLAVEILHIKNR
ncbi:MAG: glycosyltransferase [Paludibacteraceae bacterium]|nr:glycosyltransferase [Paludibacteraceae bacterium]